MAVQFRKNFPRGHPNKLSQWSPIFCCIDLNLLISIKAAKFRDQ